MRLLILFILAGFSSQLLALTEVSATQTLTKDNETYVLTQNIASDGTAFTISGNNITFDLNSHVITYNNKSSGAGIVVNGTNNKVKNGSIVQGANRSGTSPAVKLNGSGHVISYLGIKVNGVITGSEQHASGVELYSSRTTIHHVYIENYGETSNVSYSPVGIYGDHRTTAGFTLNDNIIFNSHQGIGLTFLGLSTENPEKTRIFNNYIQHTRTPGTKSPYGIALGKSRNVDIYNNQVISDEGRGIALDGLGQGVPRGTDFIKVYNNRIDVEYRVTAQSGAYVENNIYGVRDRYSSGNNSFDDNIIMVNNEAGGISTGLFIGSDNVDPLMTNLYVRNNKIIARSSTSNSSALRYNIASQLAVTGNEYIADNFKLTDFFFDANGGIPNLVDSPNTVLTATPYTPAKPAGLKLRKFFNSYVLTWNNNNEAQTFEYVLYRDGKPIDISTRGGTFYVDGNVTGAHTYSVAAKNLQGGLSSQSDPVSTGNALVGWTTTTSLRPLPPLGVQGDVVPAQ